MNHVIKTREGKLIYRQVTRESLKRNKNNVFLSRSCRLTKPSSPFSLATSAYIEYSNYGLVAWDSVASAPRTNSDRKLVLLEGIKPWLRYIYLIFLNFHPNLIRTSVSPRDSSRDYLVSANVRLTKNLIPLRDRLTADAVHYCTVRQTRRTALLLAVSSRTLI